MRWSRCDIVIAVARVFLSHAAPDKPVVRRIASALLAAGHEPWLDEDSILVGESIPAAVERGLHHADFVIICLSKAAAESGWVDAERAAAWMQQLRERRERTLPVRLEEVALPYLIASLRSVDLFPDEGAFTEGIDRLTRSIAAHEERRAPSGMGDGPAATPSVAQRVPPPTPAYSNPEVQALSEQLQRAQGRKQALRDAKIATDEVDREILQLRRQLRDGGQLRAGDSLGDDRYLLVKALGRGGFAVVWEAWDRREQRHIAIKVLHLHLASDPRRRERFFRGARVMMELEHPAVVRVHNSRGQDDAFCYFVMEVVPGGNLRDAVLGQRVEAGRRLPLILQVGEALAEAHRRGFVHRDIKPANILLDSSGDAKLTDFDLVGAADTTGGTRTGALGTVVYAAPECLDKPQNATARADVFGLGMTAIFCLSGQDLSMATFRDPAAKLEQLDCPISVRDVLKKAVCWEPDQRFGDAATMVEALRGALNEPIRWDLPVKRKPEGADERREAGNLGANAERIILMPRPHTWNRSITVVDLDELPGRDERVVEVLGAGRPALESVGTTLRASRGARRDHVERSKLPWPRKYLSDILPIIMVFTILASLSYIASVFFISRIRSVAERPADSDSAVASVVAAAPGGSANDQHCDEESCARIDHAEACCAALRFIRLQDAGDSNQQEHVAQKPIDDPSVGSGETETPALKPMPSRTPDRGIDSCDEVSCVLDNYTGACCAKFKRLGATSPSGGSTGSSGELPEQLDRSMISDGIVKVRDRVMSCGEKSVAKGEVKVAVKVDPGGGVTSVTIVETPDTRLGNCIASMVQKATFAKTRLGGRYRYTYTF